MLRPFAIDPELEKRVRESFMRENVDEADSGHAGELKADWLETPAGTMLALADDNRLHLLSFLEPGAMERKVTLIRSRLEAKLVMGPNPVIEDARREIAEYFAGGLREFRTPIALGGTDFQTKVWDRVRRIPYGEGLSYEEVAKQLGKPSAFRAVAQASGQNPLHIIVPCHRAVNRDRGVRAPGGGARRKWLLEFEKNVLEERKEA